MARTVKEWIGKNDDSQPSKACKRRIVERQERRCALTGQEFRPGDVIQYDHKVPLWLGGENRENNLQAVIATAHAAKTKAEATVRAKVNAAADKHLGIARPAQKIRSAGFQKGAKPERAERPALPPRALFVERRET